MSTEVYTDPTIAIFQKIADPSLFEKWTAVPTFIPHVRRDPATGKTAYVVDQLTLQDIANHCNERWNADGVPTLLKIGHTKPRGTAETDQPPIVGAAINYRIQPFGPSKKLALVADYYVRRDRLEEAKEYPFRSAEFYADRDEITVIALLNRDPELDLGMLAFERADAGRYFYYSRELQQMEPTTPQVDPAAEIEPDGDPKQGIDMEGADKWMQYARHFFPNLERMYAGMSQQYAADAGGMPAAGNVCPPAFNGTKQNTNGAAAYGRQTSTAGQPAGRMGNLATGTPAADQGNPAVAKLAAENADLYARNADLTARLTKLESQNQAVQYERRLQKMASDGYPIDIDAEMSDCRDMAPEMFEKHCARLERIGQYARSPVGAPPIRIGEGDHFQRSGDCTEYERKAAVNLCSQMANVPGKELSFEEALAQVRARKSGGKK